ncbi:MAG: fumarylacetoacetate hydrolase family protein [Proteobacteria bacterium]|nr:fumarylacetoacetate hydrolase family protein [Pseudomonadota bacterium]
MKLVRYGERGAERPGLIDANGALRDLSGEIEDVTPGTLAPAMLDRLRGLDTDALPEVAGNPRLGVPVGGIPKIVAIGQNYLNHIKEMGYEPPAEPVIFLKAISSLSGASDPIIKPKTSTKLDYEVEMAAVIGRTAINVSEAEALEYVAGYALMNDGSERAFQGERAGGTTKGKSADSFGPLGPWLVTSDEVGDPQNKNLWTRVNGEARQAGNTSDMVFGFAQLIAYVTEFMSLQPGDVLTTGSPHGVAAGFKPPKWLRPGDVVEMGIDGLGEQRHVIVEFPG